ncbi:MAG: ethylbenzene dehydrogenase-related protein [Actinomycetota bacterium]
MPVFSESATGFLNIRFRLTCALFLAVLIVVVTAGCARKSGRAPAAPGRKTVLLSVSVSRAPVLDGSGSDGVWASAKEVRLTTRPLYDSQKTAAPPVVRLTSVHTKDVIYFRAVWDDPDSDDGKLYWQFDGKSWHRKINSDKIGFLWDIKGSLPGFAKQGCGAVCHNEDPAQPDTWTMRVARKGPSDVPLGDAWLWAPGVMNLVSVVDDGLMAPLNFNTLTGDRPSGFMPYSVLRFDNGDAGTKQYWTRNLENPAGDNKDKKDEAPSFKLNNGLTFEDTPFPRQDQVEPITDYSIFKAGDKVPLIEFFDLTANYNRGRFPNGKPEGSRLDISGQGAWTKGVYTLEFGRKTNTGHLDDVQFQSAFNKNLLPVGAVAVFNDAKKEHFVTDPLTLVLE